MSNPAATPLRLLLADDSAHDAELILEELRGAGFAPRMTRVQCAADFEHALRQGAWDVVLADFNMPEFGGLEALKIHQGVADDVPFLLVSGTIGEEVAVSAMIAGARDYVLKDNLTRLGPAVRRELREISERKAAEENRRALEAQLRQAQKMEAVGTLAGGIAHDFNNILTAIFGYVQLAELELQPDHPARAHLAGVLRGSERARDLIRQILTFSRRREQQRAIVRPEPIVREALRLLRASLPATIEFDLDLDVDAPAVLCDSTQLHQVIMNLGTNAAHAMRERGGRLTVTLREMEPGPAVAHSHRQFSRRSPVCLTVSDTGVGMDAATRDRMFEPFFTTKSTGTGTGLGLAVVHGIVQDHDGAIVCDSTPGAGTTFRIYLPTVDVEGLQAIEVPSDLPRGQGERVLVIDDEESVVTIAARMLNSLGYQPVTFIDSQAALESLLAAPGDFEVVLSDLTMSRVTGVDLAREALALRPDLPIVITTGFMNSRDVETARSLGVTRFLEKPFTLASVAECLHQAVDPAAVDCPASH